jgi:3-hydroxyacyl-CoA dehydrogenase/enoyl-CoA hydratase/3-hydroxybutyryl-CoA epimerase
VIDYEIDQEDIAHIVWNNPDGPVNVKSAAAMAAFTQAVDQAISDPTVVGVAVRSAKRDFVAGGDLRELYAARTPDQVAALVEGIGKCLRRIERSSKPFVAVLNGSALGGGLELALACHYRVVADDPKLKLGSPEIAIGLIPGAGGTQRLPRLIGIEAAMKMLLSGKPIGVSESLSCGLVDEVVPIAELVQAAKRIALLHPVAQQPWDRIGFTYRGLQPGGSEADSFFQKALADLRRSSSPEDLAPAVLLQVLREGLALDIDDGLAVEAHRFAKLAVSASAKNRIRTQFIAPGLVKKVTMPAGQAASPPTRLGVVGAGTMGSGIALTAARSGIQTILLDASDDALGKGLQRIRKALDTAVEKGGLSMSQRDDAISRIEMTTDFAQLKGCEVVVEAVVEIAKVKDEVFEKIFRAASPDVVLASNTSTLSITKMADSVSRPNNFIGLHFFAPVDRMALVEVILGSKTSESTLARAHALLKAMSKTPVVVNDGPGFYTSRVVASYTREALHMLREGISPDLIDKSALAAGFAIGPLAMADLTSYDLLRDILSSLAVTARGTAADSQGALEAIDHLLGAGRVGRKGSGGVYDYGPEGRRVWQGLHLLFPPKDQQPAQAEVMERLLNIQSIETLHVISEGIASDPLALDLASVLGWSYPSFRGGVLARIDDVGASRFLERSGLMAREFGPRFSVPPLLRQMAAAGKTFHSHT